MSVLGTGARLVHALTKFRKSPKDSGGVVFPGRAPGLESVIDVWNSRTHGTSDRSTKRNPKSRFWVQESRRPTDETYRVLNATVFGHPSQLTSMLLAASSAGFESWKALRHPRIVIQASSCILR